MWRAGHLDGGHTAGHIARDTGWAVSPCRTARANNPGIVLTFVLPTEQPHLGKIEELLSGGKSPALTGLCQGQASAMTP